MARLEFGPIEPLGLDDFDAPADVDAAARTQRRLATGYASVFVLLVFAGPVLAVTLPWWSRARLIGGMSPNFVTVAIGLYSLITKTNINNYFAQFCAGGVIVSIPISVLFVIMQKFYVEGITGGSVKG